MLVRKFKKGDTFILCGIGMRVSEVDRKRGTVTLAFDSGDGTPVAVTLMTKAATKVDGAAKNHVTTPPRYRGGFSENA